MIVLEKELHESLYLQIYRQLQREILGGVLAEGVLLPGSRQLARTLQVSRNTVDNAYGMLAAEGYITAEKGIGYVVAKIPRLSLPADRYDGREKAVWVPKASVPQPVKDSRIVYDLTNSSHTSDLFPKNLWRKYTLAALDRLDREASLSIYLDRQGELYLRKSLRSYLERIRGIHCSEEQIVITSGLQQSIDFVCKLLDDRKKRIIMEEPGYNKAAAVFENNGCRIACVPVDNEGLCTENLPKAGEIGGIYCTPSHQFPTGNVLTVSRRYELLDWAEQQDTFVFEDDYDSELQYYAKPIPALQSIDRSDRVIYFGTFSKGLSPSIRMGYMILPWRLMKKYCRLFSHYNSTVPLLNQYVIASLLEDGQYDRHIRRLGNVFRKRMNCFVRELGNNLSAIKVIGNSRAQYCLLEFPPDVRQEELIEKAAAEGVRVYSTMQFWQEKAACPPNTLFMGLCKIRLEDIPDCVARLKKAWR